MSQEDNRSEEQIQADKRLNEQCFMLANIDTFQSWGSGISYPSILKLNGGTPKQFIGKLVQRSGFKDIAKLKPEQVSKLIPYIKLFKVYYPSDTSEGVEYELKFENHLQASTVESIMTSRTGRGSGIGIKSFEWKLAGGNPVEADRMIEAKLVLFFQSMDDLLKKMPSDPISGEGESRDVSYIDLIHQANKFNTAPCTGDRTYNNKYFRIKATVGWSAPAGADDQLRETHKVMESASATVFLTMVKHDISFDDLGGVTLSIDYMAAPEGLLSDPRADVLSVDVDATNARNAAVEQRTQLQSQSEQACSDGKKQRDQDAQEERNDSIEAMDNAIRNANAERYKAFLQKLEDSGAIYYIDVDYEEVDSYTESYFFGLIDGDLATREQQIRQRLEKMRSYSSGTPVWASQGLQRSPAGATSGLQEAVDTASTGDEDAITDAREEVQEDSASERTGVGGAIFNGLANLVTGGDRCTSPNQKRINFLFLGGILEVAFGAIKKEEMMREIRNIVGPFDYRDPVSSDRKSICLADIPISLNMFKVWYFEQAVVPQREVWTIKDFIKNIVGSLVEPAMGQDCFGACANGFRTRTNMRIMELPLSDDKKCRITGTKKVDDFGGGRTKPMSELKILPWPKEANQSGLHSGSYFMIYATGATTNSPPPTTGTREERDEENGIYHFTIGSDRGIMKKVSFKREDAPHVAAARINADGPGRLAIRAMYNADVDLVGNSIFVPGQMVFIDPGSFTTGGDSGVAGSAANILGIGGYYLVTKVDNVIESGKFETRLSCIWQSYGEGRVSTMDKYCEVPSSGECADDCEEAESEAPTTMSPPDGVEIPGL